MTLRRPSRSISARTPRARCPHISCLPFPSLHLPSGARFGRHESLDPRLYEQFFAFHIELEIEEGRRENDSYALFNHAATVALKGHYPNAVCTIVVPGLREETPLIFEDDVVQLRQLRHDSDGRFLGTQPAPRFMPEWERDRLSWTRKIYNGRVTRVRQLQLETLTVKVVGLNFQSLGLSENFFSRDSFTVRFNVQFSAPRERFLSMQHILPVIQNALSEAGSIANYEESGEKKREERDGSLLLDPIHAIPYRCRL